MFFYLSCEVSSRTLVCRCDILLRTNLRSADRGDPVGICLSYMETLTTRSPLWIWVTISFCYTSVRALTPCLNLKNKSHPGECVFKGNARLGVSVQKKFPRGEAFAPSKRKGRKIPQEDTQGTSLARAVPWGCFLSQGFFAEAKKS